MYGKHNAIRKTFLVSKLPEESILKSEIKNCFEDPNKYLEINPHMVIGI